MENQHESQSGSDINVQSTTSESSKRNTKAKASAPANNNTATTPTKRNKSMRACDECRKRKVITFHLFVFLYLDVSSLFKKGFMTIISFFLLLSPLSFMCDDDDDYGMGIWWHKAKETHTHAHRLHPFNWGSPFCDCTRYWLLTHHLLLLGEM